MTTPKWFRPEITMGTVVQVIVILASVATAWFTLAGDVRTNARDISILDARLDAQEAKMERLIGELQADRLSTNTLLTEMRTDLRYLRQTVDLLNDGGRP